MILIHFAWRLILTLTGVVVLYVSAAHDSPWKMSHVTSSLTESTLLQVQIANQELALSLDALVKSLFLLCLTFLVLRPAFQGVLRRVFTSPRRTFLSLSALGAFLFTLNPSPGGWGIILYLLLGTLGVLFVTIGAWPVITGIADRLAGLGRRISAAFFQMRTWKLLTLVFLFTLLVTNLGSYFLFEHIPHIQDSMDQVFHGKIFLLGRVAVPSPEPTEFFDFTHMINNGKWYSEYPPGHSLLMSLGHLFHAPWLINPLFGSLCVVLIYFVGREMYDERIGRLASLFGVLSPFLLFMSSEFMNHTTTLFFVELFLLGFARMMRTQRARDACLAGFGLGYALCIRPMTAAVIGSPFALFVVIHIFRHWPSGRQGWLRLVFCYGMGITVFALFVGAFLLFNDATNGDPFLSGYVVLHGEKHNPGFGHSGWGEPHTPDRGYTQTLNNLNALNKYLFELPIPALIFALLVFVSGKANRWDWLLVSYPASMALAYFFYWFQDWCFGPRFLFASVAGWLLLTARGLSLLPGVIESLTETTNVKRIHRSILAVVVACWCLGWVSNIPALVRVYSNSYWGSNRQVLNAVDRLGLTDAVVFVKSYYGSVFAANDPLLRSDVIYARDLGAGKNEELMARFPERRFYLADGGNVVPYP